LNARILRGYLMIPTATRHKFVWADINNCIKSFSPVAHNMLVRKCERRDSDFLVQGGAEVNVPELPAGFKLDAEMMMKSLKRNMPVNWCEVLAIGPKCGIRRTAEGMKKFLLPKNQRTEHRKYSIPWHINVKFQVGDLVVLPEVADPGLMYRGATGNRDDLIVDESLVYIRISGETE